MVAATSRLTSEPLGALAVTAALAAVAWAWSRGRVLGFAEEQARKHMLEVHESGRSIVWSGTREQAEAHMFALQQWHLTAVIQPDEG